MVTSIVLELYNRLTIIDNRHKSHDTIRDKTIRINENSMLYYFSVTIDDFMILFGVTQTIHRKTAPVIQMYNRKLPQSGIFSTLDMRYRSLFF